MTEFKTIEKEYSAQIVEKKSKFIANIFHVESKEQAEELIENIRKKYFDAKHHCYAYRVIEEENILEKCSDDGEPSGTAGAPMLNLLKKNELINVLVIVTRYFGGILLGTGGLVRAYSQATTEGLQKAKIINEQLGEELKIIVEYKEIEKLKYYCKRYNIRIIEENYADNVEFIVEITKEKSKDLLTNKDNINFKILKIDKISEKYIIVDNEWKNQNKKIEKISRKLLQIFLKENIIQNVNFLQIIFF